MNYLIKVKTGDVLFAGTDAKVYITLIGTLGPSEEIQLAKSSNHSNPFERNQWDDFPIQAAEVGDLQSTKLRQDGSSIGPDWMLDQVEVHRLDDPKIVSAFPLHDWINDTRTRTIPVSPALVLQPVITEDQIYAEVFTEVKTIDNSNSDAVFQQQWTDKFNVKTGLQVQLELGLNVASKAKVTIPQIGEFNEEITDTVKASWNATTYEEIETDFTEPITVPARSLRSYVVVYKRLYRAATVTLGFVAVPVRNYLTTTSATTVYDSIVDSTLLKQAAARFSPAEAVSFTPTEILDRLYHEITGRALKVSASPYPVPLERQTTITVGAVDAGSGAAVSGDVLKDGVVIGRTNVPFSAMFRPIIRHTADSVIAIYPKVAVRAAGYPQAAVDCGFPSDIS